MGNRNLIGGACQTKSKGVFIFLFLLMLFDGNSLFASPASKQKCQTNISDGDMGIPVDVQMNANGNVDLKLAKEFKEFAHRIKGKWRLIQCPAPDQKAKCLKEVTSNQILYSNCK